MTLDPQIAWVLDLREQSGLPPLETLPVDAAREQYVETANKLDADPEPMAEVAERTIEDPETGRSIGVRIYRPDGLPDTPAPALVYYHGGGWVIGTLETHDRICRTLAAGAGCTVLSVDYALAPEHKFPAAVEDAQAAFRWTVGAAEDLRIDPGRIAVGGDSAGGNLAAVVCQLERDAGRPGPCFQLLIYPATDAAGDYPSRQANGDGYLLTVPLMDWFRDHYLDGADPADPRFSPLRAASLSDLPPALVVTAGFDPLLDEGRAYAEALSAAGVAAELRNYPGMIHGFINLAGGVDVARQAVDEMAAALKAGLG